jgi:hypothetical protein
MTQQGGGQTRVTADTMHGEQPVGYGGPGGMRMRGGSVGDETKPFYMTSEFLALVGIIVALAIGAITSDEFEAPRMWTLITYATIGYMIARGLAKAGSRSRSMDPRSAMHDDR